MGSQHLFANKFDCNSKSSTALVKLIEKELRRRDNIRFTWKLVTLFPISECKSNRLMENQLTGAFCVIVLMVLLYIAYEVRDRHHKKFHFFISLPITVTGAIDQRQHVQRLSSVWIGSTRNNRINHYNNHRFNHHFSFLPRRRRCLYLGQWQRSDFR